MVTEWQIKVQPRGGGWFYAEAWSSFVDVNNVITRRGSSAVAETRSKAINSALRLADKHIKENEQ